MRTVTVLILAFVSINSPTIVLVSTDGVLSATSPTRSRKRKLLPRAPPQAPTSFSARVFPASAYVSMVMRPF